jgi:hypothetical protein
MHSARERMVERAASDHETRRLSCRKKIAPWMTKPLFYASPLSMPIQPYLALRESVAQSDVGSRLRPDI